MKNDCFVEYAKTKPCQLLIAHCVRAGTVEALPALKTIDQIRGFLSYQIASDLFFRAINRYETIERHYEHRHIIAVNSGDDVGLFNSDNVVIAERVGNIENGAGFDVECAKLKIDGGGFEGLKIAMKRDELKPCFLLSRGESWVRVLVKINLMWGGKLERVIRRSEWFYCDNEKANALCMGYRLFEGCEISVAGQFEAIEAAKKIILNKFIK